MNDIVSLHRDENTYSRRIAGKTRFFGHWRSEREGKLFEKYEAAVAAAEMLATNKETLRSDANLTDLGRLNVLRDDMLPLLKARMQFSLDAGKRREKLADTVRKTYAATLKDWNLDGGLHSRLIATWKEMSASDRAALLGSEDFARKNPELAKAVLAEPRIVTKIDEEAASKLRDALLDDKQQIALAEIEEELHDLEVVERAFNEARDAAADLSETTPAMLEELEQGIPLKQEAPPSDDLSLAEGGMLKFAMEPTDDD